MDIHDIRRETCVVRNTASKKGRHIAVAPGTSPLRHLQYGRIILDPGDAPVHVESGGCEAGLIGLKGAATVKTAGQTFTLERLDSLYVPRGSVFEVSPGSGGCDLAEIAAPVDRVYPLQFVPFRDVQQNPGLHFKVGSTATERDLSILIGKNVQAGRI